VAGKEAAERALAAAGVSRADFVMAFMTIGHDSERLVPAIRAVTGAAPVVGCSASGCIMRDGANESTYCVEVVVIASDELSLHVVSVPDMTQDPEAAGRALGEGLRPHFGSDAIACLFFADAFTLNYSAVKRGIDGALGIDRFIPFFGAGANSDVQDTRTVQFHNDAIFETGATLTLVSGSLAVISAVTHGCRPVGMAQVVTRSRGNTILELDGVRALDVIKKYVTEDEEQNWLYAVSNLALGLEVPNAVAEAYDRLSVRYVVARDVNEGSITIQTEIPEQTRVWLCRRDAERMSQDAERAARSVCDRLGGRKPKLVLHLECTGRGKLMWSEEVRQELVRRMQSTLPGDVPWFGGYFAGEIAPVGETNMFHNYTAVLAAFVCTMDEIDGKPPRDDSPEIDALREENAKLRDEIMRLLLVESDLFKQNEMLDKQVHVSRALADVGNQIHHGLDMEAIAQILVKFVLYTLNIERCVVLAREVDGWRTVAADGYYDDVSARAIATLSLPLGNTIVEGTFPGEQERIVALKKSGAPRDATGSQFLMDAHAWVPFLDDDGVTILGCLIAGNTARKARHHGHIEKDSLVVLALRMLVELAAVAIRNARLDASLREERQLLERRVEERTAEIAEVHERLVIAFEEQKRAEDARRALQADLFRAQEERLRELSTPILPITEEILVIPLLGIMDAARSEALCTVALEGVAARRAKFLILDITGVRLPDESFAMGLRKTAIGVELLGARVIVTGVSAEIARTLLPIDAELGTLVTRSTLRSGFAHAYTQCRRL